MIKNNYMQTKEAARFTGLSIYKIRKLADNGTIKVKKNDKGSRFFKLTDLMQFKKQEKDLVDHEKNYLEFINDHIKLIKEDINTHVTDFDRKLTVLKSFVETLDDSLDDYFSSSFQILKHLQFVSYFLMGGFFINTFILIKVLWLNR